MVSKILFSSKTDDWETPQELFDQWDEIYNFQVDVCANSKNAKVKYFYSKKEDGLLQSWIEPWWCNPPYGREISKWVEKASESGLGAMLLPARTDTKWFHDFIYLKENCKIHFLRGRLKFGGAKNSAPFPSMIVEWGKA